MNKQKDLATCPGCGVILRFDSINGIRVLTCPMCKTEFEYSCITKKIVKVYPKNNQTPAASVNSNINSGKTPPPPPMKPTRTVKVRRLMHAHKELTGIGIKNMVQDSAPVQVYLDSEKKGVLKKDEEIVLYIDSNEHALRTGPLAPKYKLPSGNDSYTAWFFNGSFMIGCVNDTFRDNLEQFVLNMVRSQGFRDRINDSNNYYRAVEVTIQSDCILVHWRLKETKGFEEWSTGEKREKYYYTNIGLNPPPKDRQPSGYWSYLDSYIRDTITADKQADMQHVVGGFTFRQVHNMF